MRNLIFIVLAIAVVQVTFGQSSQARSEGALLSFEKSFYDFGEITQGEKVEYTFRFTNTGSEPLIITNVTTQCGCTAPKGWPRDPVAPGERGEITLVFDSSGKFGRVNKVASVVSNATNKTGGQILLSGNILEKKDGN
jgi:Protein of unknown function (DUF1573)